jgi:hypothetical protein
MTMTSFSTDSWKQQKTDDISDALHELLQNGGVNDAVRAIDYAINTWIDYHHVEKEKWASLKAGIKTL